MKTSNKIFRILILFCFLVTGFDSFSQIANCKERAQNQQGIWKRGYYVGLDGTENEATTKHIKQIGAMVDTISNMFIKAFPNPIGSEAQWSRVLMPEDSVASPDPSIAAYMYDCPYRPFICRDGKIITYDNANLWIFVDINDYYASGYNALTNIKKDIGENLFLLAPQRGTLAGYPVFEPIPNGYPDNPQEIFYSVLIHYPGKLPYIPVTKGEFFEICQKLIDANDLKSQKEFEWAKKSGSKIDPNVEKRSKDNYQTMRNNIASQKKLNEKQLDQPAVLKQNGWSIGDIGNTDATERIFTTPNRGFQLVRPNPDYIDKSREKWKPQFMWVKWEKSLNDFYPKNSIEADKMMREKFDFKALSELLTK